MPLIAIIKRYDVRCYECGAGVDLGISDWLEVTDEDRNLLIKWCQKNSDGPFTFHVFERVENIEIPLIMKKIIQDAKDEKIRLEKSKALREEEKKKRELKKLAKTKEKKIELFEQLKKELGKA